jgi:branched-chain amino acid transport system permease protein
MPIQLVINILISCSIYLLISSSSTILYYTTKFFNLAQGVLITLGAYLTYLFYIQLNLNLGFAILLSVFGTSLLGSLFELFIYRPLRNKKSASLVLLIVSLGLYVIGQNLISFIWNDEKKSVRTGEVKIGHELFGSHITSVQLLIIAIALILVILLTLFLNKTQIGLKIRAVSESDELATIFGINSNNIIFLSFIIGSALAAIAGILVAFDTDMTPTMGFNLLLYGIVAMIIGGVGSTWGLIGGSLLLATAQHLGAYYIDSKWMDAIAYIILIIFLIWRPFGFSGIRLKKIEI